MKNKKIIALTCMLLSMAVSAGACAEEKEEAGKGETTAVTTEAAVTTEDDKEEKEVASVNGDGTEASGTSGTSGSENPREAPKYMKYYVFDGKWPDEDEVPELDPDSCEDQDIADKAREYKELGYSLNDIREDNKWGSGMGDVENDLFFEIGFMGVRSDGSKQSNVYVLKMTEDEFDTYIAGDKAEGDEDALIEDDGKRIVIKYKTFGDGEGEVTYDRETEVMTDSYSFTVVGVG